MTLVKLTFASLTALSISGCAFIEGGNRTSAERFVDAGQDAKKLSNLVAGMWVDPNGCEHWISNDGIEGYLSERLTPDGHPVCSGVAPPNTATGPFRQGTDITDPL
ncbi:hypothetical protein [Cognatiyoonia sp.]|uniref:hypothetical protein n=1 Tax=Cognatiyoonia sp. TaxID=2211652 RepID=UPI003F69BAC8